MSSVHVPVLVSELLNFINFEEGVIVDCTFGGGGHSKAILDKFPRVSVIGIDQDEDAIKRGLELKKIYNERIKLHTKNFRNIEEVLEEEGLEKVNFFMLDLGVSSDLLFDESRGFSFIKSGPLDMRMDKNINITASFVVNTYPKERLADLFYKFGEERFSRKIAKAIVDYRESKKIETTEELANIIKKCIRKRQKIHPATRVFQALRVYINDEIGALEEFLEKSLNFLSPSGRIAVISFHSLEDRVVKNFFKKKEKEGFLKIITKKPITPSKREMRVNPRSRSAKLRVGEKI
ncbi:MAG: 16S rRNA (cytosine(1402)-N(4))-methyltransferase RsmH [Proteobacteria bacterium]|nr:16S rRNA (cytosine(1402)-N(4))-methyltransferase RsmH [Pseudomonadota bacterium]